MLVIAGTTISHTTRSNTRSIPYLSQRRNGTRSKSKTVDSSNSCDGEALTVAFIIIFPTSTLYQHHNGGQHWRAQHSEASAVVWSLV